MRKFWTAIQIIVIAFFLLTTKIKCEWDPERILKEDFRDLFGIELK